MGVANNGLIFDSDSHRVEVRLQGDSVWLTLQQLADLFGRDRSVISRHLKNIFSTKELDENRTVAKNATVQKEGGREVIRQVEYFNLDAIISVGYRVNSTRATRFRQWATGVLREHLVEGYTLNQLRLQERGIEFQQAMNLLACTLENQQLVKDEGLAVLEVINNYARSWSLLQRYDEQSLTGQRLAQHEMHSLDPRAVLPAIAQLKADLIAKGEATELFGRMRGEGLASSIATIEQGFNGESFYPNVASRAAHLLYFVIKNHPFIDGNKRTGSFLFLWYLRLNGHLLGRPVERLINDNTLVALALLVAESKPEQKELLVRLVEHFIVLKGEGSVGR